MGVVTKCGSTYTLVIERLSQVSVVIPDDLYDNFRDINYLREQRHKLGMIQGKLKDEEFRSGQQERRRKRRQHAKEQKAKRLAQPPEEIPLSDIVLSEDVLPEQPEN